MPTVAFADSFDGEDDSGTRSYYLASAHDQVYAQPTGQLGFTGKLLSQQAATTDCLIQPLKELLTHLLLCFPAYTIRCSWYVAQAGM